MTEAGSRTATRRVVEKILVPTDLTRWAEVAVDYAVDLARQLGAEVRFFAVIDSATIVELIGSHVRDREREQEKGSRAAFHQSLVDDAKRVLQRDVDRAAARGVRALGHAKVSEEVEREILAEAEVAAADLIVLMGHERHGLAQLLFRSTTEEILRRAPCPVLMIRSGPRALS
jgi:nucleotide-binding universal stress UspA family protein